MKETRTINLNGMAYHIDYDAYQVLREYLSDIELRLPMDDREEVINDIEARIGELLQNALFAQNKQVVDISIIEHIQTQIGSPAEFGEDKHPRIKVDKSKNSGCGRILRILIGITLAIIALPVIAIGVVMLLATVMSLCGIAIAGSTSLAAVMPVVELLIEGGAILIPLLVVALAAIVILPIVMVVQSIVSYMRARRGPKARFWWICLTLWLASMVFWGASLVRLYNSYLHTPAIWKTIDLDNIDIDDAGMVSSHMILAPYHSIELRGAAELELSQAAVASTMVSTNMLGQTDSLDSALKVEVRDSVLFIDVTEQGMISRNKVEFAIASPEIRKITIYGAGKIETREEELLTLEKLTLNVNGAAKADLKLCVQELYIDSKGASEIELQGSAHKAEIVIEGAGHVDAEDMAVEKMRIRCAGAGKADVHVLGELWAEAAGASSISYSGTAKIKQKSAVGGSLIIKD